MLMVYDHALTFDKEVSFVCRYLNTAHSSIIHLARLSGYGRQCCARIVVRFIADYWCAQTPMALTQGSIFDQSLRHFPLDCVRDMLIYSWCPIYLFIYKIRCQWTDLLVWVRSSSLALECESDSASSRHDIPHSLACEVFQCL